MDNGSLGLEAVGRPESPQQREAEAMVLRTQALSFLQTDTPGAAIEPAGKAAGIFDGLAKEQEGKEEARNEWLRYLGLAGRTHAWAARGFESQYRQDGKFVDLDGAIYETMKSLEARSTIAKETENEKPLALPNQKLGKLLFERAQIALASGDKDKAKTLFDQARIYFQRNALVQVGNLPKSYGNDLFKAEEYAQLLLADFALRVIDGNNTRVLEEPGIEEVLDALIDEPNMEIVRGENGEEERGMSLAKATWITELQIKYALLLLEQRKEGSREKAGVFLQQATEIASTYNAQHPGKGLSDGHLQFIAQAQERFRQQVS